MTDDEMIEALHRAYHRESEPARLGDHQVRIMSFEVGGGLLTTVFRIGDGRLTLLRAAKGTYREDVAIALLDAVDQVGDPGRQVHTRPLTVDGFPLDRAVVLHPVDAFSRRPELNTITTLAAPAHRGEVRPGESPEAFALVTGGVLNLRLAEWSRSPTPRADTRLLDEWPGGPLDVSDQAHPMSAESQLTGVAQGIPAGVRLELTDVRGHRLVLTRSWDRLTGTLLPAAPASPATPTAPAAPAAPAGPDAPGTPATPAGPDAPATPATPAGPDATAAAPLPVDIPRQEVWPLLAPIFAGDPIPHANLVVPGSPEEDILEMTYQTADCGHAERPFLATLESCAKRIKNHIVRTPGNWAVFRSRSGATVQLAHEDHDPPLWLETPYPEQNLSRGRHVTVDEATRILTVLCREERSPVPDLADLQTVPWLVPSSDSTPAEG
ncbi:hypothetical protein [Actinoplanes couchii]|uniref:Uncharacterized protein n=1 Tax=Actinoplanes couchii TaxID=403638 RepID=A0ABQ3XBS3_9ACTN|nr:hypothetical protein [Actinoplanes couchii]MDR6323446.1 hypothetical protein [Actinoplanes couchii]GID55960.1 hypothetical protein Aco03nite_043640 [Actinoplanes couchii]